MTARRARAGVARAILAAGLGLAVLSAGTPARAQDDVAAAANAFTRAQRAELAGDHERAAQLYELADSIAPTPEAMRSALRARLNAGQHALAATRAEALLARYPDDAESKALAEKTLAKLAKELGRYEVTCQPKACVVLVDGEAAGTDALATHVVYLEPGAHELAAAFGERHTPPRKVEVQADERQSVSFDEPPPPPKPVTPGDVQKDMPGASSGEDKGGLSPLFFVAGASITAGLGILTIWSGVDTLDKRDAYDKNRTQSGYEEGQDLERRTNLLIVGTSVAAAATITMGIFTNWSGSDDSGEQLPALAPRLGVGATAAGPAFSLSGSF
jgi:hypothetical protein